MKIDGLKNNCVAVAIREISGFDDSRVISGLIRFGWVPGKGMAEIHWGPAIRAMGIDIQPRPVMQKVTTSTGWSIKDRMTLGQVLKAYPKGVYLVRTYAHLLVIRDGLVYDPNYHKVSLRRSVYSMYEVMNPHVKPLRHEVIKKDTLLWMKTWPGRPKTRRGKASWSVYNYTSMMPRTLAEILALVPDYSSMVARLHIERGYLVPVTKEFLESPQCPQKFKELVANNQLELKE